MGIAKKLFFALCTIALLGIFSGCGGASSEQKTSESTASQRQTSAQPAAQSSADLSGKKILIAYFSKTGQTKEAAACTKCTAAVFLYFL